MNGIQIFKKKKVTIISLSFTTGLTSAEVVYSSSSSLDAHKLSAIILKCHVDGNPIDEIHWFKNGKPVNSIGPLVIRHPTQNDNADYKCVARNKVGTVVSQPYRVEIHANAQHNMVYYAVYCEPMITNANHIENSLLCRYKRNGRFHRKRSASDGGNQSSATSKRKKINVAEDNTVTINCDVNRLDRKTNQFSVRWKKDGKVIRQSALNEHDSDSLSGNPMEMPSFRDDGRINMNTKNGSITISSTIPSDAGIYEVIYSNKGIECITRN